MDGDDLAFGASGSLTPVDDLASLTVGSITFAAGAPNYLISLAGNSIAVGLNVNGPGQ